MLKLILYPLHDLHLQILLPLFHPLVILFLLFFLKVRYKLTQSYQPWHASLWIMVNYLQILFHNVLHLYVHEFVNLGRLFLCHVLCVFFQPVFYPHLHSSVNQGRKKLSQDSRGFKRLAHAFS